MNPAETALQNEEASFQFDTFEGTLHVGVSKVGGGIVGHSYSGGWYITIVNEDGYRLNGYSSSGELRTGASKTHEQAAEIAVDMWLNRS